MRLFSFQKFFCDLQVNNWMQHLTYMGSAVNNFIGQGKFDAMETLSGRRASRYDKHQFRAKITGSA